MHKLASALSPMKRSTQILTSLLSVSVLGATGFLMADKLSLQEELALQEAKTVAVESDYSTLQEEQATLSTQKTALEQELSKTKEVLASREGFLEAVSGAGETLSLVGEVVDSSALRALLQAEQDKVAQETLDVQVVHTATEAVKKSTDELKASYEKYQEEVRAAQSAAAAARPKATSGGGAARGGAAQQHSSDAPAATGGGDGLENARAALADLGGSWVEVRIDRGVCPGRNTACATQGVIHVNEYFAGRSYGWFLGVMAHEYAHQVQFNNWGSITNSRLVELFGPDLGGIEKMADCMATVKVPSWRGPYLSSCSSDQLSYARNAWSGNFG